MVKKCMFEENKICDNCLGCNYCFLKPGKKCDNCAKCIDNEAPEFQENFVEQLDFPMV